MCWAALNGLLRGGHALTIVAGTGAGTGSGGGALTSASTVFERDRSLAKML
jgi:hypothetical protein